MNKSGSTVPSYKGKELVCKIPLPCLLSPCLTPPGRIILAHSPFGVWSLHKLIVDLSYLLQLKVENFFRSMIIPISRCYSYLKVSDF